MSNGLRVVSETELRGEDSLLLTLATGGKIKDAVQASCSAYPFFCRKLIVTQDGETILAADGGFCANNPTLYAIADATEAFDVPREHIRVVGRIGVNKQWKSHGRQPSMWVE